MTDKPNKGYFEEEGGRRSMMRLMSAVSFGVSVVLAGGTLWLDAQVGVHLTAIFAVCAFAPKAVQKFAEKKIG